MRIAIIIMSCIIFIFGALLVQSFAPRLLAGFAADDMPDNIPFIAAMSVPTSPLPTELPLIGEEGIDALGYPFKKPDKLKLRALLEQERYEELTRYLESFQTSYQNDFKKEFWPVTAFDAFATGISALEPMMNNWVEAAPESYAPYAARGTYYDAVAWAHRGNDSARETPEIQLHLMRFFQNKARKDFEKALEMNPRLVSVYGALISINKTTGRDQREQSAFLETALKHCPRSYYVRNSFSWGLEPRWGGSLHEMERFATQQIQQAGHLNRRLQLLAGEVAYEKCRELRSEKLYKDALAMCNKALESGESPYYLKSRGMIHYRMKNFESAISDYQLALKQLPQSDDILVEYTFALWSAGRHLEAGEALLLAHQIDPAATVEKTDRRNELLGVLLHQGDVALTKDLRPKALAHYKLAVQLDVDNAAASKRLNGASAGLSARELLAVPQDSPQITALREAHRKNPDSFEAARDLDYALAVLGRLDEVEAMWNAFIARNPTEPRAYLERGGTYFHMREFEKSRRDAAKACEMGLEEGCRNLQDLQGR